MGTTPVLTASGSQAYATGGAVNQQGHRPVRACGTCGREVVWLESKKTGRRYLANVSRGYLDQRFYVGRDIHRCQDQIERDRLAQIEDDAAMLQAEWKDLVRAARFARQAHDDIEAARLTAQADEIERKLSELEGR